MSEPGLLDITGRVRSPAATPGHRAGCAPPNKGQRYPADPPTVEEIILVMREAGPGRYADRTRGLIAILWRAGCGSAKRSLSPRQTWTRRRGRCWSALARAGSDEWSGWMTGHGSMSAAGPSIGGSSCPSARCSASLPARPAGALGQRPRPAASSGGSRPSRACGANSRRTSCGTLMQSRWPTKGSRYRSSRGSSGMPTSGSPRFICQESTRGRSSTQSITDGRP